MYKRQISKYLSSDENPRQWQITDLDPEKTVYELTTDLASHFTAVTNITPALEPGAVPGSSTGEGFVRLHEAKQVAGRLKRFKKPNSRVDGDLPKGIVNSANEALAVPLTLIYNHSFLNRSWPNVWKVET